MYLFIHFVLTMSKRKFHSQISCEKDPELKHAKKQKQQVEDVVCSCYINIIMETVERKSKEKCNGCDCSFAEKMELFYMKVMFELMSDNASVCERFDEVINSCVAGVYNDDVDNARKMLRCDVHRSNLCNKNIEYFKETILSVKILKNCNKKFDLNIRFI